MMGVLYVYSWGVQEDVIDNIKDVLCEHKINDILKQRKSNERKLPPIPKPGHVPVGHR